MQPAEELNQRIENMKMMIKQTLLMIVQANGNGANDIVAALLPALNPVVDEVFNNKKETIKSKFQNIAIQGLANCCSLALAQIKKCIEWQQDPFTHSILQKMSQSQESTDGLQLSPLITELQTEFEVQIKQLETTPLQEEELKQELSTQEADTIHHPLSDIDSPERQEDTPENRLWFTELLLKRGHLSDQIELMKAGSIAAGLRSTAMEKKIELSALPKKVHLIVKYINDKVYNNKSELIQSTLKKMLTEKTVKTHPPVEIKRIITMHADPMSRSLMTSVIPKITQFSATATQELYKELMQEILEKLGFPPDAIKSFFGESDQKE